MGCVPGKQKFCIKSLVENKKENTLVKEEDKESEKLHMNGKLVVENDNLVSNLDKTNCANLEILDMKGADENNVLKLNIAEVSKLSLLKKKITIDIDKIEGFEKSMKSDRKGNVTHNSVKLNNSPNISILQEEKDNIIEMNDGLNFFFNKCERKLLGNEFKNTPNQSSISKNITSKSNISLRQYTNELNLEKSCNMITGLNILVTNEDGIVSSDKNISTLHQKGQNNSSLLLLERTQENSCEEEKNQCPHTSKIIQRYNINPYQNLDLVKKYFIYQLKKSFLQVKKYVVNNVVHSEIHNLNRKNVNYHEIFSNYSQIASSNVRSYVKYDDMSVEINNYLINKNKLLGRGGYSTVYKCKNLKDNKEYAVKITDKFTRANAKKTKYEYVKDEVNILRRLHSRYVVKTYEIIETKNECLIFMELMVNNSLASKINKLDDFQIWKYFRNLICGLEHCHEIGKIVHRDINVNNLLINEQNILKLSDFGVSIVIDENNDLIPINSGPTTYTPPEIKNQGKSHYSGKLADMWCCGVTLFHMVFKTAPFMKNGAQDEADTTFILPFNPVDANLKDLLLALLDPNPENRYTFKDLKKHPWITKNGEFPLPDIYEEALEYVFSLTTHELEAIESS